MKKNEMVNANVETVENANVETKKKATTKKAKTMKKETKKVETVETVEEVKNEKKANVVLTAADINALYAEFGIKSYNPDAKGNYRIMGYKCGSSLNWNKKGYIVYSTDDDFEALEGAKIEGVELAKGANSSDKTRPNTVTIQTLEVLKVALKVYAQNEKNRIPVAVEA